MSQSSGERSFGLSVGGVCLGIALWTAWRGRTTLATVLAIVGAVLIVAGAAAPSLLALPSRWWYRLAHALGWVNTRVLLTLMFLLIVIPVGLLLRLIGREPLARRRKAFPGWQEAPARYRDPQHYLRMY